MQCALFEKTVRWGLATRNNWSKPEEVMDKFSEIKQASSQILRVCLISKTVFGFQIKLNEVAQTVGGGQGGTRHRAECRIEEDVEQDEIILFSKLNRFWMRN